VEVGRLGLGLAQIGKLALEDEARVNGLITGALDGGVTFLDTAASYGNSEELIGRTVAHRRDDYFLATKCGHWAGEVPWTAETVRSHIDRSLGRLQTDRLDLVQIHSCGVEVLEQGEVVRSLIEAREAGKTRFVGYSGDNEGARWAIDSGLFDTLQTTFNLVDQHARTRLFPAAREKGMGIIVKRTIANGAWGGSLEGRGTTTQYMNIHERARLMAAFGPVPGAPEDRILTALGFTFAHPEIDVALVGTTNLEHLSGNIRWIEEKLPIPAEAVEAFHLRFEEIGADWAQLT
jgi:hypothetical protein